MPLSDAAKARIPNQLTILRLFLAAAFFVVLNTSGHPWDFWPSVPDWALIVAIVLFIVAAITDSLDGYFARKWQVESTFGRIADPFADKVLVLGALIMLASPRFAEYYATSYVPPPRLDQHYYGMTTGVYPWMVVVIVARELLVTAIRGVVESTGQKFGANWWGKAKMILQAVVIPVCLLMVLLARHDDSRIYASIAGKLMLLTVLVTVISGIPYITGARRLLAATSSEPAAEVDAEVESAL